MILYNYSSNIGILARCMNIELILLFIESDKKKEKKVWCMLGKLLVLLLTVAEI